MGTALIEQTSKKWKLVQIIGGILLSIGIIGLLFHQNLASETGFTFWLGVSFCTLGVMIYAAGRIAAWWFHG
jgi:hypothetical protein